MPAKNGKRHHPSPDQHAFRGAAKQRKAQWFRARRALAGFGAPASSRLMFEKLLVRALAHLNQDVVTVYVGYGGFKDRAHREHVQALRAAGRGPKEGLAELSGMSRSSMIRARHHTIGIGLLVLVLGGGRGLANAYQLAGLKALAAPLPPELPVDRAEQLRKFRAAVAAGGLEPRGP